MNSVKSKEEYKSSKKREQNIDFFKTMLVLGMILSHILEFYCSFDSFLVIITNYFNLISFSGFLFCFGYNIYNAYINKEDVLIKKRIIKNFFRLTIAFWISGFLYDYLMLKNNDVINYIKILFFLKLPGYSEFLATFAIIDLFVLMFINQLKFICKNSNYLFLCIGVSLIFTILPCVNNQIPWINLLLKTNDIAFPILPYISLFFVGIYFAKNKPKFSFIVFIIVAIIIAILIKKDVFGVSNRFPISMQYIIGSSCLVYLYYYLSKLICNKLERNSIIYVINYARKE